MNVCSIHRLTMYHREVVSTILQLGIFLLKKKEIWMLTATGVIIGALVFIKLPG